MEKKKYALGKESEKEKEQRKKRRRERKDEASSLHLELLTRMSPRANVEIERESLERESHQRRPSVRS